MDNENSRSEINMKKRTALHVFLAACLLLAGAAAGRAQEKGLFQGVNIKLGLGADTLSRNVQWDKGPDGSKLKATNVFLASEFEFPIDLTLGLFAGLSFSDFKGLLFQNLPFSVEYQAGAVQGILLGGELRKGLFSFGDFETEAAAQFVSSLGSTKKWPIEGFAVPGETLGKPKWSQLNAGASLVYAAYENFRPYLGVSLSWLWGNFRMTETMGDLQGTQVREMRQKGLVRISLGTTFQVTRQFGLRGEAGIVPAKGGTDLSASLKLLYGF
jgi:hypothetical protein